MRHFMDGEERKKRLRAVEKAAAEEDHSADNLIDDEIDPADFFDPEEFGYRRPCDTASKG